MTNSETGRGQVELLDRESLGKKKGGARHARGGVKAMSHEAACR